MNETYENKKEMKLKAIMSLRVAGWLMLQGCPLVRMEVNRYDDTKHVFFFGDSEKFRNLLTEYTFIKSAQSKGKNQNERKNLYINDNRKGLPTMD